MNFGLLKNFLKHNFSTNQTFPLNNLVTPYGVISIIGVVEIFALGEGKAQITSMTSSETFEKINCLWDNDTVE